MRIAHSLLASTSGAIQIKESCKDESYLLPHCEDCKDEAIYNLAYHKVLQWNLLREILHYGLPQPFTKASQ
ncbi:hypothetical protein [Helicobacter sp.]|uniref:hypothetical protein n=1 Tax=Helicobacter sp. TaxID=218 RepID=UPI0019B0222E|nr:hypothetical protein [Helicobacter sp.]MBD5164790.1 hypothetical protein [Helicobacter sp.]